MTTTTMKRQTMLTMSNQDDDDNDDFDVFPSIWMKFGLWTNIAQKTTLNEFEMAKAIF